ncbi:MAG TPA: M48 family metalloprotease [Gemmatimonadales bacterium]|nr:M48 family metalloprotease [Gemmatimonadales bacterium]
MTRRRVLAAAALAAACALNPATGRRQLSLISESEEIRMGREYDPQVAASMGLYADSGLQRYVQDLGARLAARSERPGLPWTFRVVDDPAVNAFALPGGYIYVTRGILAHLDSEAELAAVLGHEIGHVTARHSASQLSRQQLTQVGLTLGSIVSKDVERYSGIAGAALGVLFLKYSRDNEREADHLGLRYMRRADYDAREMPDVFTMLERVSAAQPARGGRTPEWLATHPNPENRRARIAQEIAALPPDSLGHRVQRDAYLRRIDGLVFCDDPRAGYFRGTEFLHPILRFRLRFPDGWTTQNQRQAVVAVTPDRDATIQVTLAQQPTAAAAARALLGQEGVTGDAPIRTAVNGLPAVSATFVATTENGDLRGSATFVEHGGRVFQLLALAPAARWPTHAAAAERAMRSFAPLTEPAVLAVQPWRIAFVTLDRRATLAELAGRRPAPVPLATIALINRTQPDAPLTPGTVVKWVTGNPRP